MAGVDEAGRGPVIGPMVLAIASIEKENEDSLRDLGVRDSKDLSVKQRDYMFTELKTLLSEYKIVKIPAKELDKFMDVMSLNQVEAMFTGKLINSLKDKPDTILVDSPETGYDKYAASIRKHLTDKQFELICENKADANYPIVSAASILAKVTRDNEIEKLKAEFGDLGSGYSSDPRTIKFLTAWIKEHGKAPEFARHNWATTKNLIEATKQRKLF